MAQLERSVFRAKFAGSFGFSTIYRLPLRRQIGDKLPDETTFCRFRNKLVSQGKYEKLLDEINRQLENQGLKSKAASVAIVDATIIESDALKNGLMHKAYRNKPLTKRTKQFNRLVSRFRWRIEQNFGTLKRRFSFTKASYFSTEKVAAQFTLKVVCIHLLKAANKVQCVERMA